MSILIVDDEEILQDVLTSLLTKEGYSTLSAGTGREALDLLAKEEVELVLLDLMLPDTSGLEVLKRIRASDPDPANATISNLSTSGTAPTAFFHGAAYDPGNNWMIVFGGTNEKVLETETWSLDLDRRSAGYGTWSVLPTSSPRPAPSRDATS